MEILAQSVNLSVYARYGFLATTKLLRNVINTMILLMEILALISANSTDTDIHKKQLISADPIVNIIINIGTPLVVIRTCISHRLLLE